MSDDKVADQKNQGIARIESEACDPDFNKTPEVLVDWTPEEERKLVRKIDWRTIPYLSFVFCLSLLDRTNISKRHVQQWLGMDLHRWRCWTFSACRICLQYYVVASSIFSLVYFLPLILREPLGFSYTKAQLLFSPPYLIERSQIFCIIIFLVMQAAIGIAGLFIILFVHAPYVRYFGVFLGVWGIQASVQVTLAYGANNAADPANKGIISAAMITAGAIGGITGSTIFRVQDTPRYLPGMGTTIAFQALYIVLTAGMDYYFKKKNKDADEKGTILEGVPGFHYAP
ncbi:major facilitator superfamily transporter [Fusarium sp. NRRL 52700]|nr:major facilitator superfamily transporter [Fusarium sp. NRRL 52700]